jgi:hypothetical protein
LLLFPIWSDVCIGDANLSHLQVSIRHQGVAFQFLEISLVLFPPYKYILTRKIRNIKKKIRKTRKKNCYTTNLCLFIGSLDAENRDAELKEMPAGIDIYDIKYPPKSDRKIVWCFLIMFRNDNIIIVKNRVDIFQIDI